MVVVAPDCCCRLWTIAGEVEVAAVPAGKVDGEVEHARTTKARDFRGRYVGLAGVHLQAGAAAVADPGHDDDVSR